MKTYHVAKTGLDTNTGTQDSPFLTINAAAAVALAGDTIIVHKGEYREWVKPRYSGLSDTRRIIYKAADGEKVVIKGSERINNWVRERDGVWKATIDNTIFGGFNPYTETVSGDWLLEPYKKDNSSFGRQASEGRFAHLGDVYLNGMSFYEADCLESVYSPKIRETVEDNWTQEIVPVKDTEQTKYLWFAEINDKETTIYANFHDADPNVELVEINVRKCCFYPEVTGIDYITVSGFELAQAACPWTPPTADQPGLIGTHWSRGWIIENNIIHDAKCSAVSIGKEGSTGNNDRTIRKDRPGYQYQLEAVFKAHKAGWSKEKIGSHVIRNNIIYDCGQNGIVGHLGCVFSQIYGNHIYNIAIRREFYGHEIAGIKLHAPIDVVIRNNHIHSCSLGIWLDWQAQGTRISSNLLYDNNRDFFIEVSHGPAIIDHNIFASKNALYNDAQGMAYINNIFGGKSYHFFSNDRATPYHTPHSTDVAGYFAIFGGDDRYSGNIFIGDNNKYTIDEFKSNQIRGMPGTALYNNHPTSLEEYIDTVDAYQPCDHWEFSKVKQPVYIDGNVYLNGALSFDKEENKLDKPGFDASIKIEKADGKVYLNITLPDDYDKFKISVKDTKSLGRTLKTNADYDNPDGSPLRLDTDYFGKSSSGQSQAGPISELKPGVNRICVW